MLQITKVVGETTERIVGCCSGSPVIRNKSLNWKRV